jgi:hypothetical protein
MQAKDNVEFGLFVSNTNDGSVSRMARFWAQNTIASALTEFNLYQKQINDCPITFILATTKQINTIAIC